MGWDQQKNDTEKGFIIPEEQEHLEGLTENDKSPEFDVIGTPLNGL